ncbi:ABC transporter [Streptomonospora alba]|uniref:ABC transporter n=1 Tax=Streptomonospora alba TaxID=183763 RepID=A0A0C2G6W5_9ACTN|nr:sugar ABC transporter permease [Streptomonospora alba]KIH99048.1 ABC transporter [Streptomonospora alba]
MSVRRDWRASLLLMPAMLFFTVFALGPLIAALCLSFLQWNGITPPQWSGLENWGRAFTDPATLDSIKLTLLVIALSWLIQTPASILLGAFLAGYQRYRALLGVFYFLPLLFSAVAVGLIWQAILSPQGALNSLLRAAGADAITQPWLGSSSTAIYAVIIVIAWQFIPLHTLLYQAAVRQIPQQFYEAARIDGAGKIRQFVSVTLPQLKYTLITSSILIVNGSITYFDIVFVLTGGGPEGSTRILPLHMYITAFQETQIGYGSAIAILMVVLGLALSLVLLRISGFSRMESQAEGA